MTVVVLTLLVCLLLSAAVAVYVAYPSRGRPLPAYLTWLLTAPRRAARRARPGRLPASAEGAAEGAQS